MSCLGPVLKAVWRAKPVALHRSSLDKDRRDASYQPVKLSTFPLTPNAPFFPLGECRTASSLDPILVRTARAIKTAAATKRKKIRIPKNCRWGPGTFTCSHSDNGKVERWALEGEDPVPTSQSAPRKPGEPSEIPWVQVLNLIFCGRHPDFTLSFSC